MTVADVTTNENAIQQVCLLEIDRELKSWNIRSLFFYESQEPSRYHAEVHEFV
jgi:hypothetical protein